MKADDPLTPWLQLQALYAQQLVELGRTRPDLALLGELAARADRLLPGLAHEQELRPLEAPERRQIKAAAAAAAAMLERAQVLLEQLRGRRLEHARRRERASSAALAYKDQGTSVVPRFLDQRL